MVTIHDLLPEDLLGLIFREAIIAGGARRLGRMSCVCKAWSSILEAQGAWQAMCTRRFPRLRDVVAWASSGASSSSATKWSELYRAQLSTVPPVLNAAYYPGRSEDYLFVLEVFLHHDRVARWSGRAKELLVDLDFTQCAVMEFFSWNDLFSKPDGSVVLRLLCVGPGGGTLELYCGTFIGQHTQFLESRVLPMNAVLSTRLDLDEIFEEEWFMEPELKSNGCCEVNVSVTNSVQNSPVRSKAHLLAYVAHCLPWELADTSLGLARSRTPVPHEPPNAVHPLGCWATAPPIQNLRSSLDDYCFTLELYSKQTIKYRDHMPFDASGASLPLAWHVIPAREYIIGGVDALRHCWWADGKRPLWWPEYSDEAPYAHDRRFDEDADGLRVRLLVSRRDGHTLKLCDFCMEAVKKRRWDTNSVPEEKRAHFASKVLPQRTVLHTRREHSPDLFREELELLVKLNFLTGNFGMEFLLNHHATERQRMTELQLLVYLEHLARWP